MLGLFLARRRFFSSDLKSLASLVCKENPSIKSSESILNSLKRLKEIEGETNIWIKTVCASPSIMDFKSQDIAECLMIFDRYDISKHTAWATIGSHPELIRMPASSLRIKFSQVDGFSRSLNISIDTLLKLSSLVLFLEPQEIANRLGDLQEYFTKSQVRKLFLNSPVILYEEWSEIQPQILYLLDVMHVHVEDILDAPDAFTISLQDLKLRYSFLQTAGIYKHPDPKGVDEGIHALPLLRDIIQGSDADFLKRVNRKAAILTMEEFQVYTKMLEHGKDEFSQHFDAVGYEDEVHIEEAIEQKKFAENVKTKSRKRK